MEWPSIYVEEHYKKGKQIKKRFCYEGLKSGEIHLLEYNTELATGETIPELIKNSCKNKVFTESIIENKPVSHIDISQYQKSGVIILRRSFTNSELEELAMSMAIKK